MAAEKSKVLGEGPMREVQIQLCAGSNIIRWKGCQIGKRKKNKVQGENAHSFAPGTLRATRTIRFIVAHKEEMFLRADGDKLKVVGACKGKGSK